MKTGSEVSSLTKDEDTRKLTSANYRGIFRTWTSVLYSIFNIEAFWAATSGNNLLLANSRYLSTYLVSSREAKTMAVQASVNALHPRLVNFFARYPPSVYSAKFARPAPAPSISQGLTPSQSTAATNTSSSDPNAPMAETESSTTTSTTLPPPSSPSVSSAIEHPNPFLPHKNPISGRWRAPQYSLRRQADLVKLAKAYGVEPLLPPGKKSTEYKEQRTLEKGLRVKGTGEGQKVKGHKWERMKAIKLDERKKAMEGMPEMIQTWKQVCLQSQPDGLSEWLTFGHREVMGNGGKNILDELYICIQRLWHLRAHMVQLLSRTGLFLAGELCMAKGVGNILEMLYLHTSVLGAYKPPVSMSQSYTSSMTPEGPKRDKGKRGICIGKITFPPKNGKPVNTFFNQLFLQSLLYVRRAGRLPTSSHRRLLVSERRPAT